MRHRVAGFFVCREQADTVEIIRIFAKHHHPKAPTHLEGKVEPMEQREAKKAFRVVLFSTTCLMRGVIYDYDGGPEAPKPTGFELSRVVTEEDDSQASAGIQ